MERPDSSGVRLHCSVAGHLPPLLVEGTAPRVLTGARSLSAVPAPECTSAMEPLPPGSTLRLYSDGLVERREEDLLWVRSGCGARVDAVRRPLEDFWAALLTSRPTVDDDVAMLVLRFPAPGRPGAGRPR